MTGEAGWTAGSTYLHHALGTSQVWARALIHTLAERHGLQSHYWSSGSSFRPSGIRAYQGHGQGHVPLVQVYLSIILVIFPLSSYMGLTHHLHIVNLNACSFQGVPCVLHDPLGFC